MNTRITTLIENNTGEHKSLYAEHGLSFFIEHNGTSIVFDTGQSDKFTFNAEAINIDLRSVNHVVLSHGHYDHTNGLPFVSAIAQGNFTLWTHEDLFAPKWATNGLSTTYLGPSYEQKWALEQPFKYETVRDDATEISRGVFVVTNYKRTHALEVDNPRFVLPSGDNEWKVDDFHDEISIVLKTEKGLVVVVGCSHPGIMNMLSTITSRFSEPVIAVLGGTHLVEAHGKRLREAIGFLTDRNFGQLGLSHCTGDEAMDQLEVQSNAFYRNTTGTSLII